MLITPHEKAVRHYRNKGDYFPNFTPVTISTIELYIYKQTDREH